MAVDINTGVHDNVIFTLEPNSANNRGSRPAHRHLTSIHDYILVKEDQPMAVEPKRGCGYRKVGGIYLVSGGEGRPCGCLQIPLHTCPSCRAATVGRNRHC
jgi:hypothetical protein